MTQQPGKKEQKQREQKTKPVSYLQDDQTMPGSFTEMFGYEPSSGGDWSNLSSQFAAFRLEREQSMLSGTTKREAAKFMDLPAFPEEEIPVVDGARQPQKTLTTSISSMSSSSAPIPIAPIAMPIMSMESDQVMVTDEEESPSDSKQDDEVDLEGALQTFLKLRVTDDGGSHTPAVSLGVSQSTAVSSSASSTTTRPVPITKLSRLSDPSFTKNIGAHTRPFPAASSAVDLSAREIVKARRKKAPSKVT